MGAQRSVTDAVNKCVAEGRRNIYMQHAIVGQTKLEIFDEKGELLNERVRRLEFNDEKPSLTYFEVPITDNCNLNCKGCLFACNLTKNLTHFSFDQIEKDARRMNELFYDVPWIRILGGEPLMHPDIVKILALYRRLFPDSEIDLCTNGLLIPKMDKVFWETVIENRISIHISGYRPTYSMLDKIDAILLEKGIPYAILKREEFSKYYTKKDTNDKNKSFDKCQARACYELYNGRLATCSAVIAFEKFNEYFQSQYSIYENEDWFDIHQESVNAWHIKEILDHPSNLCRYCSDGRTEIFEWDYSGKEVSLEDFIID